MNQLREITVDDITVAGQVVPDRAASKSVYARVLKRPFDLAVCILLLPVVAPIVTLLWVLVRSDGGRGFYGHMRVGRDGRMFRCWKLRSMVPDGDRVLADHLRNNPDAYAEWSQSHKLKVDPRITRIGRLMRKTSLDELPQLWNVLTGDMSLVGPRPVTEEELDRYGASRWAYEAAKPGITGLWQVSGRNKVSYQRRVALDVRYVENLNFAHDLRILARTGAAVWRGTGA